MYSDKLEEIQPNYPPLEGIAEASRHSNPALNFTRSISNATSNSNGSFKCRSAYGSKDQGLGPEVNKRGSFFADPDEVKAKVRASLAKPVYNVQDEYWDTGVIQAIAKSALFEKITLSTIAFNALWIAIDTDYNDSEVLTEAPAIFQVMEHLFCAFFLSELLIRFFSFRDKRSGLRDAWFLFDSVLVLNMVAETWILTIVLAFVSGGSDETTGVGDTSILRVARVLRLSRMARMARLLRAMPELMILVKGLVAAMRSVFFALCLLLVIIFVFAIAFTQLTGGMSLHKTYFARVTLSMYTLLFRGALLDNVSFLINEIGDESLPLAGLFIGFVLISALTVMNMLIGVLCQVVSSVAAMENEEASLAFFKSKMEFLVHELDTDGNNEISRDEFCKLVENPAAIQTLLDVGVDPVGLVDYADFIFCDDITGEEHQDLTVTDFMEVVLELRGSHNATVKDIVDLRKFVAGMFTHFEVKLDALIAKRIRHSLQTSFKTSVTGSSSFDFHRQIPSVNGYSRNEKRIKREASDDSDYTPKEKFLQDVPEGFGELINDDISQSEKYTKSLVGDVDTSLEGHFQKLDLIMKAARTDNLGMDDLELPVCKAPPSRGLPKLVPGASRGLRASRGGSRPVLMQRQLGSDIDANTQLVPSLKDSQNHQGLFPHQRMAGDSDDSPPKSITQNSGSKASSIDSA